MKTCFACKEIITTITENFIGDVKCPICSVMNSFYDPKDFEPEEKEDAES